MTTRKPALPFTLLPFVLPYGSIEKSWWRNDITCLLVFQYQFIYWRPALSMVQTWSLASTLGAHSTFSVSKCFKMTANESMTTPEVTVLRCDRCTHDFANIASKLSLESRSFPPTKKANISVLNVLKVVKRQKKAQNVFLHVSQVFLWCNMWTQEQAWKRFCPKELVSALHVDTSKSCINSRLHKGYACSLHV